MAHRQENGILGLALTRIAAGLFGVLCAALAYKRPDIAWLPFHFAYGGMMLAMALLAFWFAALGHILAERKYVGIALLAAIFLGSNGAVEGTVMWMIAMEDGK